MFAHLFTSLTSPDASLLPSDVDAAAREWPFFTLPAAMLLRRQGDSLDPELRRRLLASIAHHSSDPARLFLIAGARDELINFYPAEAKSPTTDDTITRFLDTYGRSDPQEDALLERLIFNPVAPDYLSTLTDADEAPADTDDTDDTIAGMEQIIAAIKGADNENAALAGVDETSEGTPTPGQTEEREDREKPESQQEAGEHSGAGVSTPSPSGSLSESLAKIYIRQKRFDKAFEIIHTLSLKNPKKSAYFADQLRFLRKLMALNQI